MRKPAKTRRPTARAVALEPQNFKTVVVVGSGRGGTSSIAGALHLLGVRMCESDCELNSEDSEIVRAYQGNMHRGHQLAAGEAAKVIARRNERYSVWGWKDPSADLYLESVITILRNPHFLFVLRNPVDVAMSHVDTNSGSIEVGLDSSLRRYMRYWKMLQRFGLPTLLVSYERSMADRKGFIDDARSFLNISPTNSQIKNAFDFMDPNGGYRYPTAQKGRKIWNRP